MAYVVLVTAWIGDGSRITMRQVWNFINGDGMTINVGDRVQAFSHPLWFFILSGLVAVTRELFLSTLALSISLSLAAVALLLAVARRAGKQRLPLAIPVWLLLFSVAFIDYTTSGLENPLSFFLIGLLLWFLSAPDSPRCRPRIFLTLALLVLTRFDYAVLFLPLALLLAISSVQSRGFRGLALALASRSPALLALAAGQALYLGFIVRVGGDFMIGRFFAVPVFLSVGMMILAFASKRRLLPWLRALWVVPGLAVAAVLLGQGEGRHFPFLATREDAEKPSISHYADQRGIHYRHLGLLSRHRQGWPPIGDQPDELPRHWYIDGEWFGANSWWGRKAYHIDDFALADPLLARLPAIHKRNWRIGHFIRKPPTDYGDFLIGKTDRLADASLNNLAGDILLAMRGPLFTRERLAALWRLNTGHHSGIDLSRYQDPRIHVPVSSADAITMLLHSFRPLDPGARWHVDAIRFDRKLRLEVVPPRPARELRLRLSRNSPYELRVNGEPQATLPAGRGWALQRHTIRFAEPRVVETIEIRALTTAENRHFIRDPRLL